MNPHFFLLLKVEEGSERSARVEEEAVWEQSNIIGTAASDLAHAEV